jgi:hypothetical protein
LECNRQESAEREIRTLRSRRRGLETWHGRDAVTLADERARQQENTNFDLNRRASLRPYRENLHGDAKGKGASGYNHEAESTDAPVRGGLPRSGDEAG